jgi:hypothetical protein
MLFGGAGRTSGQHSIRQVLSPRGAAENVISFDNAIMFAGHVKSLNNPGRETLPDGILHHQRCRPCLSWRRFSRAPEQADAAQHTANNYAIRDRPMTLEPL